MKTKTILLTPLFIACLAHTSFSQWIKNDSLYGGRVSQLAANNNSVFVSTPDDGIFRSTDNGKNWERVLTDFYASEFTTLVAANDVVFASSGSKVLRSTDNGENWKTVIEYSTLGNISSLVVKDSYVFAAANTIIRSTNNGDGWSQLNISATSLAANNSYLFAGKGDGVFRSADNGDTWENVMTLWDEFDGVYRVEVSSSTVFALTRYDGIHRSKDNGNTWEKVKDWDGNENYYSLVVSGDNVFVGTNYGIIRSTDHGDTWELFSNGLTAKGIISLVMKGEYVFAGATGGGGVSRSTNNGDSWEQVNNGLAANDVISLVVRGTNIFAGTDGEGIFRSTDNGTTWEQVNNGLTDFMVTLFAINDNNVYAVIGDKTGTEIIVRSTNNGDSWEQVLYYDRGSIGGYAVPNTDGLYVGSILINDQYLFVNTGVGLFRSADNGDSWELDNTISIDLLTTQGNLLIATTYTGFTFSIDNGNNWAETSSNPENRAVQYIIVKNDLIFAATEGIIFRLSDNGWERTNNGLGSYKNVNSMTVVGDYIFAGITDVYQDDKIFVTSDNGDSWKPATDELADVKIYSTSANDNYVFVGTNEGIWSRPLDSFIITGIESSGSTDISLYPNPTTNQLTIVGLTNSPIHYKLLDVAGREYPIELNSDGNKHHINVQHLPTGLYMLSVQDGYSLTNIKFIKK